MTVPDAVVCVDRSLRITYTNQAARQCLQALVPEPDRFPLDALAHASDLVGQWVELVEVAFARGLRTTGDTNELADDGRRSYQTDVAVVPADDDTAELAIIVCRDVTDRADFEAAVAHDELHDSLTGLPNRSLFAARLTRACQSLDRRPGTIACCFLDMDDFRLINRQLGPAAADDILIEIAERLESTTRSSDTVARVGGDEFAVCIEDLSEYREAEIAAQRLLDATSLILSREDVEVEVSASIGVAIASEVTDPAELLKTADTAMGLAKKRGGNQIECTVAMSGGRPSRDRASISNVLVVLAERTGPY